MVSLRKLESATAILSLLGFLGVFIIVLIPKDYKKNNPIKSNFMIIDEPDLELRSWRNLQMGLLLLSATLMVIPYLYVGLFGK